MNPVLRAFALLSIVLAVSVVSNAPAYAVFGIYECHDHPNGNQAPPTYGLRVDNLIVPDDQYTFSFDHFDGFEMAAVTLTYDMGTGEIHIFGRAYGGRDTGAGWDPLKKGWINIDFTYRDNISQRDDCAGAAGDDVYVTAESANNNGFIELDGWGGNITFNFTDKAGSGGCTFVFDNDTDSKGNAAIEADPAIYSASGWIKPPTGGSRDWLFIAEMSTVPVHSTSWGRVKALFE